MLNAMLRPTSWYFIPAGLVAIHKVAGHVPCTTPTAWWTICVLYSQAVEGGQQYGFGIVSAQNGILPCDPSVKGRPLYYSLFRPTIT